MSNESFAVRPPAELVSQDKGELFTVNENFADAEIVSAYQNRNRDLDIKISDFETQLKEIFATEEAVQALPADFTIEDVLSIRETLRTEKITAAANYPGDWTSLLQERMCHPETKKRFIAERQKAMVDMKEGNPGVMDKPKEFQSHYQEQIDHYVERVESIFALTYVGSAASYSKKPQHLGEGNINQPGTVFADATHKEGVMLTARQKNIIEAHEKGHGLRDFRSPSDIAAVMAVIDEGVLDTVSVEYAKQYGERFPKNYLKSPEEIIERMAQFKNYFGMTGTEIFTKHHLDYIREHYVNDTGLDNLVTPLLSCVTPRTEPVFLSILNTYPI